MIAVSLLLAAASCLAQDAARMDQIVQSNANQKFMGTALVARDGRVLFSKGYGFANLEWNVGSA
jgi:CubicO group peptidase (beta-lactamase class C family)